ncbi:hypothetical protein pb186bvf_015774 [Paramecium bursaria]
MIDFRVLTVKDIPQISHLIVKIFTKQNPTFLFLKVTEEEAHGMEENDDIKPLIKEGYSIGAFEGDRLVSFIVSGDLSTPFYFPKTLPLKTLIFYNILDKMTEFIFDKIDEVQPKQYFFVGWLITDEGYQGKGLVQQCVKQSLNLARESGFKQAFTEASNPVTRIVLDKFLKLNRVMGQFNLKDYVYEPQPDYEFNKIDNIVAGLIYDF